jgi:hypothetical protein
MFTHDGPGHAAGRCVFPVLVDALRFHYHLNRVEWINMLRIWMLAHQLGFFRQLRTEASRRIAWPLSLAGRFRLPVPSSIGGRAEPAQRGMPARAHDWISLETARQ